MCVPGKRTPADPADMGRNTAGARPRGEAAGPTLEREPYGDRWEHGEAPVEGAYREKPDPKRQA